VSVSEKEEPADVCLLDALEDPGSNYALGL
jgi:hypothetical protein